MTTTDLFVNLTEEMALAEGQESELLPSGIYKVTVFDGELKEVKEGSANAGKHFWNLQLSVVEGPYEGRRIFSRVMLFGGQEGKALRRLVELLKALGHPVQQGQLRVPGLDQVIGRQVRVRVFIKKDKNGDYPDSNQVAAYLPPDAGPAGTSGPAVPAQAGPTSLLP